MRIHHVPHPDCGAALPQVGGVREHIRQLSRHLEALGVEFVSEPHKADLVHVQTSYPPPRFGTVPVVNVFTCHGGFVPPIAQVRKNLDSAAVIISVAQWIVDDFFPEHKGKTVVIPNGIALEEWDDLGPSGLEPGYILWGKGFSRPDWFDFYRLAEARPDLRFVSTLWSTTRPAAKLSNLEVIGLQTPERMRKIINDCAVYVSTGSEVCPTMILEAWACRKPVLAADLHGNRELMGDNRGGWRYSRKNHKGEPFNNPGLYGLNVCLEFAEEKGQEGREAVEMIYNWPRLAHNTLEVYRAILGSV